MAPRGRRATEAIEEPQAYHELGVRGRKTGVLLPNRGELDKDGFQPLDSIFSSPQKAPQPASRNDEAEDGEDEEEDTGSEDMDIASSAGPGPRTLLKEQRNLQYPLPRSRSPIKTTLLSPARRNPHLDRLSSPIQEDREATVTRKLDFASQAGGRAAASRRANGINGTLVESDEDADADAVQDVGGDVVVDDSLQMVGALQDDSEDPPAFDQGDEEEEDEEEEPGQQLEEADEPVVQKPVPAKRSRGRPRTSLPEVAEAAEEEEEPSAKKPRGRPPKQVRARQPPEEEASQPPRGLRKRRSLRNSSGGEEPAEQQEEPKEEPRQAKRQRTEKAPTPVAKAKPTKSVRETSAKPEPASKPKGRSGRPPKAKTLVEDTGETSFAALQKGPPMPKRRGLVSIKRDPDAMVQTRAGRQSFRPLQWWAGDRVITEVEEREDMFRGNEGFVTRSTKEVFRAPEDASSFRPAPRSKGRPKSKAKNLPQKIEEEVDPPEDWELDTGVIEGEVMGWEPEYERHPPADDDQVNVSEDLLAISADAVQTKDIKDATFRFAKTLTMPFMGSGIVDLPPGTEKRPKNSRKMHMVFFVHFGKVLVTVNETEFRISSGGQWFVPRGNYYSITNDYDNPARIFFAQANEVLLQAEEPDVE